MDRGTVQTVPCRVSGQWTEARMEECHSRPVDWTRGSVLVTKQGVPMFRNDLISKGKTIFASRRSRLRIVIVSQSDHSRQQ